ncbi:toll-like receptor 4 [Saccostrea echinata]|uniref:toll-like receptor 4 n=1 Tax=Saccostrea echinata TaxID=191078 RepID=UPI002A8152A1|nr:toll-like receptor 4 [Saccostrea echinata]
MHLRNFSISWNRLFEVQKGTFHKASDLENLDISNNKVLTIDVISNISQDLRKSSIKTLNFEKLQCTYGVSQILKINHIAYLKSTTLLELNLASNRINSLETGALAFLPKSLLVLNLADNVLSFGLYIIEFASLQSLEILNVSFQSTFHQNLMSGDVFEKCNDTRRNPNLEVELHEIGKHYNMTSYEDKLFPKMDNFLKGNFNYTVYLPPNLRKFYYHDNLYKMSIPKFSLGSQTKLTHVFAQQNIIYEVIGPVTGLESIKYIDFSGNFCGFISKLFLKSFSKLEYLNLSNNALGHVFENDKNGEILSAQRQLLTLDLSINRIYRFSEKVFLKNKYPLKDIEHILDRLEKTCSSYTVTTVVMISLIISAVTVTVSRIVYRYRWKLRYMYFVAKNKYKDGDNYQQLKTHSSYRFDAFISYADEDRRFVIKLVEKVEKEYNIKLCIHHRDFIPGTGIMDNITNAIHCSRRTVCVMTTHFLKSYWCMYELNMARMEAIYSRNGNNVLFLIVLDKNILKRIPLHLMDLVDSKSYMEYPGTEKDVALLAFISKLGETLKSKDNGI